MRGLDPANPGKQPDPKSVKCMFAVLRCTAGPEHAAAAQLLFVGIPAATTNDR